mgnify:CR=1 FL=1
MVKSQKPDLPPLPANEDLITQLIHHSFLFRGMSASHLQELWSTIALQTEKLYSNRPVFTAFRPGQPIEWLYVVLSGGPVILRSSPLDRIVTLTYPGGCFGMRSLPLSYGDIFKAFPSQMEAYKTTDVIKVPITAITQLYETDAEFRDRYHLLFELREKFQYHLLNCSAYPPQAVATLLRGLIYQERALADPAQGCDTYTFDLPVDVIARSCQLNHRTVEQVLKGMQQVGLTEPIADGTAANTSGDLIRVVDPEGMKEVYSTTRDKVSWWPLR